MEEEKADARQKAEGVYLVLVSACPSPSRVVEFEARKEIVLC